MKIDKIYGSVPPDLFKNDFCKVTEMGNVTEIMRTDKKSMGGHIQKVSKDNYINLQTGELKSFKHIDNRSQDLHNVAKSLKQGRDLINTNVVEVRFCRWLTLTYAENMTDSKKLCYDFGNFVRLARSEWGQFEYITAAEPQGRGAWHLHCLFIFNGVAPFMDNSKVSQLWKKGFVTVKRLDDVDNVGAYLTAYLGDMELSEVKRVKCTVEVKNLKEVEFEDENGKKFTKRYVKGARLSMYPPGMHIFRWSKGIKKPNVYYDSYKRAKEKASSGQLTYSSAILLSDEESNYNNLIQYEHYNKIRKE